MCAGVWSHCGHLCFSVFSRVKQKVGGHGKGSECSCPVSVCMCALSEKATSTLSLEYDVRPG